MTSWDIYCRSDLCEFVLRRWCKGRQRMGDLVTRLREWASTLRTWATSRRYWAITPVPHERFSCPGNKGPAIHVLVCNNLNESEYMKILKSLAAKLQTEYVEHGEHYTEGISYTKYIVSNNGCVPCDSAYDTGLIVILSKDQNKNSLEVVRRHVKIISTMVEIENVIALTTHGENDENHGASTTISLCPSIEIHRVLHSLLPGYEENILDQKINVFLTGLNDDTLNKVKKALSVCIDEKCIQKLKISKRSEVDSKLSALHEDSVAICCVHDSTRLIIISDTEEDEVGDIIKAAEGKCGKQSRELNSNFFCKI
ncbi:uncharacterized protein LOC144925465 [Branchiostoma floridae x Branchiostoma belcheri]